MAWLICPVALTRQSKGSVVKANNIKPGVKATTKLNGRDQVVTVIGESLGKGGPTQWIVRTPAGNQVYRTARQLRALAPVAPVATLDDGIDAVEDRAHARVLRARAAALAPFADAVALFAEAEAEADHEYADGVCRYCHNGNAACVCL